MTEKSVEIAQSDPGAPGEPGSGPDLATVLLSLYQCLTDPERYFEMVEILTHWLDDAPEAHEVQTLSEHSDTIWETLRQTALPGQPAARSPALTFRPNTSQMSPTIAPDELLDHLTAEDVTRLSQWIATEESDQLLVRHYAPNGPAQIAILERLESGEIALFRSDRPFSDLVGTLFKTEFGITPRELDVIEALSLGQTPQEAAASLGKSVETIRSQIKSVTAKLGVRSQTDIVRMAMDAEKLRPDTTVSTAPSRGTGARRLTLPDGRQIEYEIDPPQDGHPVIFFHCVTFGRHWSNEAHQIAAKAGLRMIRISRAGFGGSTVNRKTGAALLAAHVADYAAVLAHERIGSCTLMAQGLGMAAAYQFALAYPEKVTGITGLDIPPPVLSRADAKLLHGLFKTGSLGNLIAPGSTKLIASFATRYLQKRRGPEVTAPLALKGVDLSDHESASGLAAYRANYVDAQASHGQCYWREASYSTVDWADAPTNANHRPRVQLLQTQDSVLVSPGAVDAFATRIDAKLRQIDSFLPLIAGPMPEIVSEILKLRGRT